ncbi:unnamed protein product [Ostreobium quekettii]|uniref:Ankyrin repeat n=1 Tax=Ostreobium quekettii TaxID=121088 RepID=A0A8S1J0H2_9CHLO|nr:unnamed protein product [Ostreobium quekettii]
MLRILILALVASQGVRAAWVEDRYARPSGARRLSQELANRKEIAQARNGEAARALKNQELLRLAAGAPNETTQATVDDLLASGADPDACCSKSGGSALHEATAMDNDIVASSLLGAGADVAPMDVYGYTPLHTAAISNAVRVATVLLDEGADVDAVDNVGATALHLASEFGSAAVAEAIIDAGANVTAKNDLGKTPRDLTCARLCPSGAHSKLTELFAQANLAAQNPLDKDLLKVAMSPPNASTTELVESLLDMGASADACCTDLGGYALHATTAFDNEAAARALTASGAALEVEDLLGSKPLHAACSTNALAVAKVLLEEGANAEALDHFSQTPLHVAASFGRLEHCQALLMVGANRSAENVNGERPADVICEVPCPDDVRDSLQLLLDVQEAKVPTSEPEGGVDEVEELSEGAGQESRQNQTPGFGEERSKEEAVFNLDLLNLASRPPAPSSRRFAAKLLSKGADPNACCLAAGASALHATAELDNDIVAAALISAGAAIDPRDDHGDTPLHVAAVVDAVKVARLLIDAGADLEAVDEVGDSPLHHAAEWGAVGVAGMLVEAGADVWAENGDGYVPGEVVCEGLCEEGGREGLEALLSPKEEEGSKQSQKNQQQLDEKLLEISAGNDTGSEKDATKLLARGADPDACCLGFGSSALHAASQFGNTPVARVLVTAGASLSPQDDFGQTPLHDAAIAGADGVAKVLIGAGAEVDPRDRSGRTPLHLAAESGSVGVAEALLSAGADPGARDDGGMTPADVICETDCGGEGATEAAEALGELLR